MYLKSIEEVSARLAQRYDGPTYERQGGGGQSFTYVPWHVNIRLLDEIFGAFGWSMSRPEIAVSEGLVHVALSITVRAVDEDGNVVEKTVPGVGSATLRDDNSAKSAMSDALSKGVKFLGDAFAFFLSEEKKPQQGQGGGGYQRPQGQGNYQSRPAAQGDGPSPAQISLLKKKGATQEQIDGLRSKKEASDLIDSLQWAS